MRLGFLGAGGRTSPALAEALARLDRLVDLERADRSAGAPAADALRRVDLGPERDLCARLGHPERAFRAVHVAGTKGKGTVAALVARGLSAAGLRVGLYASPHVEHARERVQVGGSELPDDVLAHHLTRALDARAAGAAEGTEARDATWFDVFTAAAFDAFAAARVDWAVVEVGLGGRLDSTNVVDGEVCVVTNIDLEHTAILGSTRAAIAAEKAGILKPGCTALTGVADDDAEVAPVLARRAAAVGAELVHVPQRGPLVERNRALSGAVLDALGARGLCDARGRAVGALQLGPEPLALPGRLERRSAGGVPVVLDGAHVPSSLRAVLDELGAAAGLHGPPVVVLGMGRDKDAEGLLKALAGRSDRVLCTSAGAGPYRTPLELSEEAARLGVEAEAVSSPRAALQAALRRAQPGGWVLVTGSLHLVGAVRGLLPPAPEEPAC